MAELMTAYFQEAARGVQTPGPSEALNVPIAVMSSGQYFNKVFMVGLDGGILSLQSRITS